MHNMKYANSQFFFCTLFFNSLGKICETKKIKQKKTKQTIDASSEFESVMHSNKARNMTKQYLIGKVKGETLGDLFANN